MERDFDRFNSGERWITLDAFRGWTVAGMIVVNTPGFWEHVYPPLLHAEWQGIILTDLVFPFFLYIVGVSIALALTKRIAAGAPRSQLVRNLWTSS